MVPSVEKRIAFALLVFKIDKLVSVMPTFSASSDMLIFRFASTTSMLTIIGTISPQIVSSFSFLIVIGAFTS
jgi:hypothetical protein